MNKEKVLGIVRHILTFAGGFVVAKGLVEGQQIEEIVGAVVTIIGAAWSVLSKKSV
jgi:hypothetical protein